MADATQGTPADTSKLDDIVELVKRLCVALTNVEMFSATHPVAKKHVDSVYQWITRMFAARKEPVVVSATGKSILLDGLPLEVKNPLVVKLAARFDDLHINNLFFEPGLTEDELSSFYDILGKGPKYVNEHGGLPALLAELKLPHIKLRDISYVMVSEGEKVVSKDAKVVDGSAFAGLGEDAEIVKYMVSEVMKRADQQKWLLNEMKNNPHKMADVITEGINLAVSRKELGAGDAEGTVEALLSNIKTIGANLMDEQTGEVKEGQEDLEKAVVTLENEMRLRAKQLTSSKVSTGFINEILSVVTSYSDQVRAKQITGEFLRGEKSLKKTEKLLRDLTPQGEQPENFLVRIQDLIVKQGMTQEDLQDLVEHLQKKKERPAAPKKPKKAFSQAVFEGVSKRLKGLEVEGEKAQEVTEDLSSFIEARAKEKAVEYREEAQRLKGEVSRRDALLKVLQTGVVLWSAEGKATVINPAAKILLKADTEFDLRPELRNELQAHTFPLTDLPDFTQSALNNQELQLLLAVQQVLKDDGGNICGVILAMPK